MLDEHVEFFERAFVEQELNSLARRKFAAIVLSFDTFRTTSGASNCPALLKLAQDVGHPYTLP